MQIQSVGLNTVIPTVQHRHMSAMQDKGDSLSFSGKDAVVKKPIMSHLQAFINKFKLGAAKIENHINLPKVENFDELIARLDAQGIKYETSPANLKDYKKVHVYTSMSQNPVRVYSFRKNNSLYELTKNNGEGNRLSSYRFKKDGSPKDVHAYDVETNRAKGYAEFKSKGPRVVTLNPKTNKYFEETGVFDYKDGKWIETHPDTYEIVATHEKLPRAKKV